MSDRNMQGSGATMTVGLLVLVLTTATALAQTAPAGPSSVASGEVQKIEDFRRLFEEREALVEQQRELRKTIDDLSFQTRDLPSEEILNRNLKTAERDLKKLQKDKASDAQIDTLQRYIDTTTENIEIAKSAMPLLLTKRGEYDRAGRKLFALEQRIASLFDASRDVNRFRTNVTFTFGILVFVVIVGFYIIAWHKQGVATTIFSGAMGMQFVTLFLIVIAIILFGIMGTLQDKELAALLGGLSGYILGRADHRRAGSREEAEPAKREQQPIAG